MSGLTDLQTNAIKHLGYHFDKEETQFCMSALWYSTSDECYVQRSTLFDSSIFCKDSPLFLSIVDDFLMAFLSKVLGLTVVKQFTENAVDLENEMSTLFTASQNVLLLHNPKKSQAFLYAFDTKLRNAIAHGTFRLEKNKTATFYGQFNKKQSSIVNFYFTTDDIEKLTFWLKNRNSLATMSLLSFQKVAYSQYFGELNSVSENCFITADGTYVIFDNNFRFADTKKGGSQDSQLLDRIVKVTEQLNLEANTAFHYLILESSLSRFTKVLETWPNAIIVPSNKLLNHFGIEK